jgi:hypothetical protein
VVDEDINIAGFVVDEDINIAGFVVDEDINIAEKTASLFGVFGVLGG